MQAPIVTLTTDFGTSDHYVGTMKGVILSRCPEAQLVDISHDIPPFSIHAGAYAIQQAAPYFPARTVHLIVVDPGVGTPRKAIVVESGRQIFVAPDNGVLSFILARDAQPNVREITNHDLFLPVQSSTFHGRDIFAPVAAALAAASAMPDEVGPPLPDPVRLTDLTPYQVKAKTWKGIILSIDRFGNAVTNLPASDYPEVTSRPFVLETPGGQVNSFYPTFGSAPTDACFVYLGSSGYVEIGMNRDSASARLHLAPGSLITLRT
jgi:S-adenosylmethionine hydrolase